MKLKLLLFVGAGHGCGVSLIRGSVEATASKAISFVDGSVLQIWTGI